MQQHDRDDDEDSKSWTEGMGWQADDVIIGVQVTARARGHAAGQLHLRGACDPGGGTREKTQSCQVARSVPVTAIAVSPPEARQTSSGQEVGAKRPREKVWGISGVGRGKEGPA